MVPEPSKLIETLRGATEHECERLIKQLIRNVERETALECAIIAAQHYNHVSGVHAIRKRFNLEGE